ncbi:MAG: hypothetical protein ABSH04_04935 [Acidimicrobiales bacterium]
MTRTESSGPLIGYGLVPKRELIEISDGRKGAMLPSKSNSNLASDVSLS